MRVYPEQLTRHLSPLHPCYLIFGDDPWLVETTKDHIRLAAKRQGFAERIELIQDTGFHWHELSQEWQAMSLFSSKRLIELVLPQGKPGTEGAATLQSLLQAANPDTLLLIEGPKLSSEQTNSKWFKALDAKGIYLPCATPEGDQFMRWLDSRIKHFQLHLQPDARAMLYALYEGNLLAADQAMQLLQLLSPAKPISAAELSHYFEDQSRFTVFQLTDALLGNRQDSAQHNSTAKAQRYPLCCGRYLKNSISYSSSRVIWPMALISITFGVSTAFGINVNPFIKRQYSASALTKLKPCWPLPPNWNSI